MKRYNQRAEDGGDLSNSKVNFVGRCDGLKEQDLHDFDDTSRSIGYQTFARHVGSTVTRSLDESFGVPISKDPYVSFVSGKWKGQRAVCMFHSAYHHIWVLKTH